MTISIGHALLIGMEGKTPTTNKGKTMKQETLKYIRICATEHENASVQKLSCKDVRGLLVERDELVAALVWAAKNLEEVAIPMAQRYGHVTSLDGALERARAALAKVKGDK